MYWTGTGRSRLNSRRIAAAASGELCIPNMICTGSPGVARVTAKIVSDTTSRTSGICASRVARVRSIGAPGSPRQAQYTVSNFSMNSCGDGLKPASLLLKTRMLFEFE